MTGRIVIAGGGGQVGSVLAAEATRRGRDVLALTSSRWDITDPQLAAQIVEAGGGGGARGHAPRPRIPPPRPARGRARGWCTSPPTTCSAATAATPRPGRMSRAT